MSKKSDSRERGRPVDAQTMAMMDDLIRRAGGDPDAMTGSVAREMMHTALKLLRDRAHEGEMKLISRSLKELRYALKVFRPYEEVRKISVFGSARTAETHPDYITCVDFSRQMAEAGWMVITGAGGGIMAAGHGGAGAQKSFGVAIRLPFEQATNAVIADDPKLVTFRYFFTRKLMFMWQSHAIALFPGGFGTQDEGFEALTLIQTGKAPILPIVMIEQPGGDYWKQWARYVREELLAGGLISEEDLHLFHVTDNAADATRVILDFYRNYHSQRYVNDVIVLRMLRPLTPKQLEELNREFASLVAEGTIEQGGPLPQEKEHLQLPRLHFTFGKKHFGTLRQLINRVNHMDAANA
ncbi:MAG: LOG family protein [Phycisphaeraceae bacterium]